jgi:hypothetical protein
MLAASLTLPNAFASDPAKTTKKHVAAKKVKPAPKPTVEDQINALRQELQGQITNLKSDLAQKDAELKQAQQAAAEAQTSAAKAEAAATTQQQAVSDNSAAVSTLKTTVDDMKGANASIASQLSDTESKSAKKSELSDLAFGKVKIGATVFADFSYWSDYGGASAFYDNQITPSSTTDKNFNTFEVTRAYINLIYTPNDAVSVRITPDIFRPLPVTNATTSATDQSLAIRLKYAYIDLNKLFAGSKYIKNTKITFGQTQNPLVDWEEGLSGHRYTYKVPLDYAAGLSSTYVGVKGRVPVELHGKTYLDSEVGIFTNGTYSKVELSETKQFMGRATWYPLGTKKERTGLGLTIFGDLGFNNTNPSDAVANHYSIDRTAYIAHYQTADKGYLIAGEFDQTHNVKSSTNQQQGFAFFGNARLGNAKSPFHLFGQYQYFEPNNGSKKNDATKYARTVGGLAYKFNKNLDIALGDSNFHYLDANASSPATKDTNVITVFTQYSF